MFTHPDRIGQLASKHHRHMLAEVSQRQLRHQHGRRPAKMPNAAVKIRRLAEAIATAGVVAADTPGATWPARPRPLADPAGDASTPGH